MNNFRVFVGLSESDDGGSDPSKSTGGHAPALAACDAVGGFLDQVTPSGRLTPDKIGDGKFRDYALEGRQGADYLSVVRTGGDGICISLITGVSAGAGRQFMWSGDMAKACGLPWYNSANPVTDSQPPYVPACAWIDGKGENRGHIWKGFNMHLGSFPGTNTDDEDIGAFLNLTALAWTNNRDLLCKSEPRFSAYEDIEIGYQIRTFDDHPATGGEPGTDGYKKLVLGTENWRYGEKIPIGQLPVFVRGKNSGPIIKCGNEEECPPKKPSFDRDLEAPDPTRRRVRKRHSEDEVINSIKKRQIIHADRLIVSNFEQHSAVELCDSPYSLGPDMVSTVEGMFCDMSEKKLWPGVFRTLCLSDDFSVVFLADASPS